jgi:hypothetical protein
MQWESTLLNHEYTRMDTKGFHKTIGDAINRFCFNTNSCLFVSNRGSLNLQPEGLRETQNPDKVL